MKKIFCLGLVSVTLLTSCASNQSTGSVDSTSQSNANSTVHKKEEASLSNSKKHEELEKTNLEEEKYPKITKMLLNGKSWYEGNSIGVENQPRQGFSKNQFHDLIGNELEYEIIVEDTEETYKVLDFRNNELVDIRIKTKIVVNKPRVDGTYIEVVYCLYYKYDGTLMIAREGISSEESDLTSYPLEEINVSRN